MATMNEAILDASVRHQVQNLRFTKGEVERALRLLKKSDEEIVAKLQGDLTAWNEAYLKKQLKAIRQIREQTALKLKDVIDKQAQEYATNEADWELDVLQATSPVQLALNGVAPALLKAVAASPVNGVALSGWLSQMVNSDVTRMEQAIRLGILQGETKAQMVKRVMAAADVTRNNASTIVRTTYNHISNASKQEVWSQNADILAGVRWSAMLDGRTSPICRSRDGVVYPVDKGPRPPGHPNCRSQVVPVVKGEAIIGERPMVRDTRTRTEREKDFRAEAKEAAGDSWKGMSVAQRNAAVKARRVAWTDANVGSVPSNVTYNEWLGKQPKAFQNEVLGPARAKLFREGMTLDKFVDASGKQYTLAELKLATKGDALNVMQPGVGLKAKALMQQGFTNDEVLFALKKEFPNASPTMASMASYKSELKKAGLLDNVMPLPNTNINFANSVEKIEGIVNALENTLPPGIKHNVGGQWLAMAEDLQGSPGAYAFYESGKGVVTSVKNLAGISTAQAQQVLAHELGHLLHKQHQVDLPDDVIAAMKASAKTLSPDGKKLYSYYLAHMDELTAEVYAQALTPSPITSQGLLSTEFNKVFEPAITAAKKSLADKFPVPSPGAKVLQPGAPVGPYQVAGKHQSIGSLAKALLQQGMPDEQVLIAVKAEFPSGKTGMNSIKSYKSELNKQNKISTGSNTTVVAKNPLPSTVSPAPPMPVTAVAEQADDALNKIMASTPATGKINSSLVKNVGVNLMEAGVLNNNEVLAALKQLYPHNQVSAASVATWKSVWKASYPEKFAKAQAKHIKLDLEAASTGPTQTPFLHGKPLGPNSSKIVQTVKDNLAAGASLESQQAVIEAAFGGAGVANPQGVTNLLDLAAYQFNTAKAAAKPYLNAATTYSPPMPKMAKAPEYQGKILPADKKMVAIDQIQSTWEDLQQVYGMDIHDSLIGKQAAAQMVNLFEKQGMMFSPKDFMAWVNTPGSNVPHWFKQHAQELIDAEWVKLDSPAMAALKAGQGNKYQNKIIPAGKTVATHAQMKQAIDDAKMPKPDGSTTSNYEVVVKFAQAMKDKDLMVSPKDFENFAMMNQLGYGVKQSLLMTYKNVWKALESASKKKVSAGGMSSPIAATDFNPTRLASTPYDGMPPPPRFSQAQHRLALQHYGEPAAPSYAKMVNDKFHLQGDNRVTPEEIGAIRSYTGNKTYEQINRNLRAGNYSSMPAMQAFVEAAQHGMRKMPAYVGPVTRGVRWLPPGMSLEQFMARYKVGTVVEEHSFLSTSKGTDAVYNGPVYFKINSKTGRDVDWISKYSGGEKEVLMMPGTRLHITKVEKNSMGKMIIYADEV